jgi:hypothetical protein
MTSTVIIPFDTCDSPLESIELCTRAACVRIIGSGDTIRLALLIVGVLGLAYVVTR